MLNSLTVRGTPAHLKYHAGTSVIVSGGGQECNSASSETQNEMHKFSKVRNGHKYNMQFTINSFRQLFHDKIF